jgi:N-acetylglutamate synthase-like GNAT family acetyltransferase/SAM-dependent methyltransferase
MLASDRMNERSEAARAGWTLRPARAADLPAVRGLLSSCKLPAEGVEDPFGDRYVVAEDRDQVVGVAGIELHGAHGLLRSVAVAPESRLSGVGAALVLDRLQWAEEAGVKSLYLLTTDAARYFHRHGFRAVAREAAPPEIQKSREFSEMCPSTARLMRFEAGAVVRGPEDECCGGNCACKSESNGTATDGSNAATHEDAPAHEDGEKIREVVREHYAQAARNATQGSTACCGGGCGGGDPITRDLYEAGETAGLPANAVLASLGCGNPTLLAELREGESVLDLGSGGGIDVLLSARRVGPTGFAYGIDMTDEMLALARENQRKAGVSNVEFRKGEIEAIPLPASTVDVVISNCVINLSADKRRVLAEAFRVLKPGGRFAVSDIVVRRAMPEVIRRDAELWAGCVAGALEEWTYRDLLRDAGFVDVEVVPTRIYAGDDVRDIAIGTKLDPALLATLDGAFMSAFVRAHKPVERP